VKNLREKFNGKLPQRFFRDKKYFFKENQRAKTRCAKIRIYTSINWKIIELKGSKISVNENY
jgi:hypothetical protein